MKIPRSADIRGGACRVRPPPQSAYACLSALLNGNNEETLGDMKGDVKP